MRTDIRDYFPVIEKAIYLNHAAIGPSPKPVTEEVQKWMVHHKSYGDMYFSPLNVMYEEINRDREVLGKLINARFPTDEISFTYNTSYGLAAIAEAIPWKKGDTVILNYLEYTSNSYTYQALARKFDLKVKTIPHVNGKLPLEKFQAALDQTTRLVAISHVQFSNGFRSDLETLTSLIHEVGGEIIVDGIQSLGAVPLDVQKTNIDYLAAGGYKWLLAPMGTGFMYVKRELADTLQPSFVGSMSDSAPMNLSHHHYVPGPSAKRFQASLGPNSHLLSVAVNFLLDIGVDNIFEHLLSLTDIIIEYVQDKANFELKSPVDDVKNRSGIINFTCPNAESIIPRLRKLEKPIAVSYREKGIRISPHCYNTADEVRTCLETISQLSVS